MNFLIGVENSGFSTWVRGSASLWSYPFVIFLHAAGLSLVVGLSAVIDLAVLGFAPGLPLAPMQKLYRVIGAGFWINVASGVVLTMASASTMVMNPVFWIKMTLIGLAVAVVLAIKKRLFRNPLLDRLPVGANVKVLAVLSLILWAGAITAGRMTAYLGADPYGAGLQLKRVFLVSRWPHE